MLERPMTNRTLQGPVPCLVEEEGEGRGCRSVRVGRLEPTFAACLPFEQTDSSLYAPVSIHPCVVISQALTTPA